MVLSAFPDEETEAASTFPNFASKVLNCTEHVSQGQIFCLLIYGSCLSALYTQSLVTLPKYCIVRLLRGPGATVRAATQVGLQAEQSRSGKPRATQLRHPG